MKKRESRIAFNNTSMLDVIFIILIFFISVSRLNEGWLNIKLPEAGASKDDARGPQNALTVSIDAENRLMADKRPLAGEPELVAVARSYVEASGPEGPVIMVLDRGAQAVSFVAALKVLRDAGLSNITFSYEPRKERS